MTPAEFRCLREYLGLTTQWLAVRLGVTSRAVLRYESPGETVPAKAASLLEDLAAQATIEVLNHKSGSITVPAEMSWHYGDYPPTWYRMIAARIAQSGQAEITYGEEPSGGSPSLDCLCNYPASDEADLMRHIEHMVTVMHDKPELHGKR